MWSHAHGTALSTFCAIRSRLAAITDRLPADRSWSFPLPPLPLVNMLCSSPMIISVTGGGLCRVAMVTSLDPLLRLAIPSPGTFPPASSWRRGYLKTTSQKWPVVSRRVKGRQGGSHIFRWLCEGSCFSFAGPGGRVRTLPPLFAMFSSFLRNHCIPLVFVWHSFLHRNYILPFKFTGYLSGTRWGQLDESPYHWAIGGSARKWGFCYV